MSDAATPLERLVRRHLRIGWWSILAFLTLGMGLEWLHGTKVPWYLNDAFETRRHLWTLAHAHGVMLGLVHVAFSATLDTWVVGLSRPIKLASDSLSFAVVLMPAGFFLGGAVLYEGGPGPAVGLLPIGGILLLIAVALIARNASRAA